ncbi:MAG: hypothetical protein ACD_2C00197G0002 [uncultured bacterium (gcode 4)]|uniref:Uncharacterized protein n=1 Tax=uncultured bacterium (gcode 4) TaxID=1234023 RepID=K2FDR9_9BACT|nr:MAG: hypothetical protein ACD_2C00197G0002 [uncultured bacterium (gcode 4)]
MGNVTTIPVGWAYSESLARRIIWKLAWEELSQELQEKIRTSVKESLQQAADEWGFKIIWERINS